MCKSINRLQIGSSKARIDLESCPSVQEKNSLQDLKTNLRQQVCHPPGCHLVCHLRANFDSNRATTLATQPHPIQVSKMELDIAIGKERLVCQHKLIHFNQL